MSLKQKLKKIKCFYRLLLILLVCNILAFILLVSYLLLILYRRDGVEYVFDAFEVPSLSNRIDQEGIEEDEKVVDDRIVASKNGSKYYYPACSGISRIKNKNRVFFNNSESAERGGYELAKNCKKP